MFNILSIHDCILTSVIEDSDALKKPFLSLNEIYQ